MNDTLYIRFQRIYAGCFLFLWFISLLAWAHTGRWLEEKLKR